MRTYATGSNAPTIVLGHGAGAGHDHPWMRRVGEGLRTRGVSVVTFNFPYMEARRSAPDRANVLEETFAAVWREVAAAATGPLFAGGKSMGGRIASQVAAQGAFDPAPVGLTFFGYPLHPPGKPEQRRDRHLPSVAAPMLFLHGTRDPFGSPEEMTTLVAGLSRATLEIVDGGDHSLERRTSRRPAVAPGAAPAPTSLDHAIEVAASWILAQATRQTWKPGHRGTERRRDGAY
jgi:uncharacterized protein